MQSVWRLNHCLALSVRIQYLHRWCVEVRHPSHVPFDWTPLSAAVIKPVVYSFLSQSRSPGSFHKESESKDYLVMDWATLS